MLWNRSRRAERVENYSTLWHVRVAEEHGQFAVLNYNNDGAFMIFPERRNVKQVDFRRTSHIVPQNFTYGTEVDSTVAGHPSYRRKRGGSSSRWTLANNIANLFAVTCKCVGSLFKIILHGRVVEFHKLHWELLISGELPFHWCRYCSSLANYTCAESLPIAVS